MPFFVFCVFSIKYLSQKKNQMFFIPTIIFLIKTISDIWINAYRQTLILNK
jgi:hypothetical protein